MATAPKWTLLTECWVPNEPITKGSVKGVGKGKVVRWDTKDDGTSRSATWAAKVRKVVQEDRQYRGLTLPWAGSVAVRAVFWTEAPKADLDKLIRNVLDALSGVVYVDDNQVTMLEPVGKIAISGKGDPPLRRPGLALQVWGLSAGAVSYAEKLGDDWRREILDREIQARQQYQRERLGLWPVVDETSQ